MKLLWGLFLASAALAGNLSLNIAGLKLTPGRWDKEGNLAKLERYAREAAAGGAQLVVTPEGFLEGYVGNRKANPDLTREKYFAVGEGMDGLLLNRVRSLARALKIYLSLGFAERRGGQMFNSMVVFSPGGEVALHYSKEHNDDDEPFNTLGTELNVAATPLGKWGALICYDRQLPETARILSIKGAQLILVPAWGGYGDMNEAMMRTRAFENSVWIAFVHPKSCLIIDPKGTVVARDRSSGDEIVKARIEFDGRIGAGAIRSRRPEMYPEILK